MSARAIDVQPPIGKDSVKFLVIGDSGTGDRAQNEIGAQMWKAHAVFPFEFAIMLGDNMYGSERPQDYVAKFERPFKPMLDAKIPFYASLGNHDDPNQRYYKNFNMGGKRFYTYQKKDVRFFALDSNYMDQDQQRWLEKELSRSNSKWKIAYFHHPIYSSGGRHGSEVDLRAIVEPLFIKYGLNVVFAGHEHFYERLKPQKGIYYFTGRRLGEAALRRHHRQLGADRQGLRHRAELHAGRDRRRRDALPDHLAPRQARRLRRDPPRRTHADFLIKRSQMTCSPGLSIFRA